MRFRRAIGGVFVAGALWCARETRADDAGAATPEAARRARVVATIGSASPSREAGAPDAVAPSTITVGELEDRIAAMPGFQRASFGASPDAIRRRFLGDVLVPQALLALAAAASKTDAQPAVASALDRARSSAVVRALREAQGPVAAVSMTDVRAYYEKNRARYDAPERYRVWRILCKTRDEAQEVLGAALADPTPKAFAQLARDHSQDKATALRGGNLGFLTADGESTEPGLRVDTAVVHAAQAVRDGDLVRTPVVEGDFFSVVWRRGTLAAQKRAVDDVAPQIREILHRAQLKDATDHLVADLRAAKVRDLHAELLDGLELPAEPEGGAPR